MKISKIGIIITVITSIIWLIPIVILFGINPYAFFLLAIISGIIFIMVKQYSNKQISLPSEKKKWYKKIFTMKSFYGMVIGLCIMIFSGGPLLGPLGGLLFMISLAIFTVVLHKNNKVL